MLKRIALIFVFSLSVLFVEGQSLNNTKLDGYRGIWFELNQKYEYGDKYSGALATYTADHIPMAIYAPEVDKTFFVYGGTASAEERHLLCMIGEFNHKTGMVPKPTVVCDKEGINDPHDNPSLMIDDDGYIHVFISGRSNVRPGYKFRSKKPFNIDEFEKIAEEEMTYPQPWNTNKGYMHLFTKYTGIRQLYFETSIDGINWTEDKLLAAIVEKEGEKSGHYQLSGCFKGGKIGTFFNRHPNGDVDKRTDIFYAETANLGKTWTNIEGELLEIPLLKCESPARVIDYRSQGKNIYLNDMGFDPSGNPVLLYIRSNGHEPGPMSAPYEWCITSWNGKKWLTTVVTESDHNYDMGSLFISEKDWKIVGPTIIGPQKWGVGGELALWQSTDKGKSWHFIRQLTHNSKFNHSYVRRPMNYKSSFCFLWADGDSHSFSKSRLYFGDFDGNIWQLPYEMKKEYEKPKKLN